MALEDWAEAAMANGSEISEIRAVRIHVLIDVLPALALLSDGARAKGPSSELDSSGPASIMHGQHLAATQCRLASAAQLRVLLWFAITYYSRARGGRR